MKGKVNLGFQTDLGRVNEAFENDPQQMGTFHNAPDYGFPISTAADEKRNVGGKVTTAGDEESGPKRQQWANGTDYLMSCITLTVGLGNVWKFPYMAYSYGGGGAFLIPYLLIHVLIGKPLYYLEMCIGQFVSRGPVKVWALSPALQGLGYGQTFAMLMVLLYFGALMALAGFYFVHSFAAELPWSICSDDWDYCFDFKNNSDNINITYQRSSSELFFYKYVLNEPDSIEDGIGDPDWRLTIGLFVCWVIILLIVIRGVRSSGKAAYFLAMYPYVVLISLMIRAATLPGAGRGLYYFFSPDWDEMLNPRVWYTALTQTFFSLNIFFGTIIMYSSFNAFRHNVYRDSMIVTTLDTCTSVFAGCTVFAVLGHLMDGMNEDDINNVVRDGPGVAFVTYAKAIAKFGPISQLFAVLFFIMLYALGVGSAVAHLGSVTTIICDNFPNFKYWVVAIVTCVLGFVGGLVYVTPGALYILTLMDHYGINFPILVFGTIEIVGLAWIYGVNNIADDLEFMLGLKSGLYCRLSWAVTPILMIIAIIYGLIIMEPAKYNGQPFPEDAYVAGWVIFGFAVSQVPLWILIVMYRRRGGSFLETIKNSFQSSELWRPQDNALYKEWKDFKESKRIERLGESLWQKIVRTLTGYSPQRSSIVEPSNTEEKF